MRRILFTVMAAAALCVAVPTAALAHGSHHKRHHHSRVHHKFFRAHRHDPGSSTGSSSGTAPTAGTVTSFANNVLTITLTNGSTVSGTVTGDTELKCENPQMQNGDNDADDNGGTGNESGDAVFDHHGDGGGDNGSSQTCTPTPGMAVRSAELTINGNGSFWTEVELVNSSTSTTTPTTPTTPSSQS